MKQRPRELAAEQSRSAPEVSMKSLLSDDLWSELTAQAAGHQRIRAAIGYVTAPYLDFREGDLLICDASNDAVKGGLTSASLLRSFVSQGAEVFSYDGLHSKVAVIDDQALIGSANLSENAGVNTCEASLLTDDRQVIGLIQGFIEKVKGESQPVDEDFLRRIESLPVVRNGGIPRRSKKRIDVGQSKVWLIATRELSDRLAKAEAELDQIGMEEAQKHVKSDGYEVRSIRWSGKSRFRSDAKPGDLVMEVYTEKRGKSKRKYVEVYQAVPILHRQDEENWTRFYLEVPAERLYYGWKDIKADFASLGVLGISPNSTRELTGKALGILQLME
jgi:hypothetical protein